MYATAINKTSSDLVEPLRSESGDRSIVGLHFRATANPASATASKGFGTGKTFTVELKVPTYAADYGTAGSKEALLRGKTLLPASFFNDDGSYRDIMPSYYGGTSGMSLCEATEDKMKAPSAFGIRYQPLKDAGWLWIFPGVYISPGMYNGR